MTHDNLRDFTRTDIYEKDCPHCNGTGKLKVCPICQGRGSIAEVDENTFKLKKCPNGCPSPAPYYKPEDCHG